MSEPPFQTDPVQPTRTLHSLQVRAFLQAAEDVLVDAETVADVLDGFTESLESDDDEYSDNDGNGDNDDDGHDDELEELDISALYDSHEELENTWTHQEVRAMMQHLKEKGLDSFIHQYVITRQIPIPKLLLAFGVGLCPELRSKRPETLLYFLRVTLSREIRLRNKLPQYNTLADAVSLINNARRIVILTGAGISVSCGIPDFRSRDGLYATLKREEWDLDDPQQMFDINYFRENPAVFYSFAREIYPSNFTPSPCHRFIKLVEMKGKLLRNYSQNIDTLETLAGVERVLQCHGSFARATCLECKRGVPGKEIEQEIMKGEVPLCRVCNANKDVRGKGKKEKRKQRAGWNSEDESEDDDVSSYPPGIMKPDITFFGEKLTTDFDDALLADRGEVDLLLVIGTSLKVAPVSDILCHLPHSVPQILINKTPVRHINPDIILLGNADDIILHLCRQLEWELPPAPSGVSPAKKDRLQPSRVNMKKRPSEDMLDDPQPRRVGNSHVWLFRDADGGKWLQDLEKILADSQNMIPRLSERCEAQEVKKARLYE